MTDQNQGQQKGTAVALMADFRRDLDKMESQFTAALPEHIPAERFTRVVMTAIQNNPKLLACRRQSLFNACMKAAQDGLLPDGREGAIVPFGEEEDGKKGSDTASWMPMVAGIRKKARNSGELRDLYAHVVYENDEFDYQLGDEPRIHHKPSLDGGRVGRKIIAAYSIAVYNDGTKSYEVMGIDEVEDIRKAYSRAKRGPWSDPVAYPEMARKTVVRKHAKTLPSSTDLDRVLHRDDELYDFKGAAERQKALKAERPNTTRAALDHFAGEGSSNGGGGKQQGRTATGQSSGGGGDDGGSYGEDERRGLGDEQTVDDQGGGQQQSGGGAKPKVHTQSLPKNVEEYREHAQTIIDAAVSGEQLNSWFVSEGQRKLRNACGLLGEDAIRVREKVDAKIAELKGSKPGSTTGDTART